ncbi:MAG: hypothetical protein LUG61_04885 [Lachnospiraceae bacterium]|nr:hypothetical protein [Lachnospiraceae bacterium]
MDEGRSMEFYYMSKDVTKENLDFILTRYSVCTKHPEQEPIFRLESFLIWAGYRYFFNFWEDMRPTPFNHDGEDPESIDWDKYNFEILIDKRYKPIEIEPEIMIRIAERNDHNTAKEPLLDVTDYRNGGIVVHPAVTAWDAFDFIKKYFDEAPREEDAEHYFTLNENSEEDDDEDF